MTTFELFVTTIIGTLAVGIIVGGLAMEVLVVRPLQRRHSREHQRVLNAFRQGARHLGTPYIVPLPAEPATDLSDNDRWPRKTPELVSLPRVETGRPV